MMTKKSPAQLQREIDEVIASPGSFSYEEATAALAKKHAGIKRGGSLRAGHAPVVPKMSASTRWDKAPIYTLSDEQLEALRTFAKANGRSWKFKLNDAWSTGRYANYNGADDYGSLQQIRNRFGPSWLVKFSFDNVKTHSVKG